MINQRGEHQVRRCHISEEWNGCFIGRRRCSIHDIKWESGGPCPSAEHWKDKVKPRVRY